MPKIIENLREQLLREAERQICENGYKNTTIRSVAGGCGVAVGTVYNYFKSKDMLIAGFVLGDWLECINSISAYPKEDKRAFLNYIYTSLTEFAKRHTALFTDGEAAKTFNQALSERHKQLRDQLSELIMPISGDRFLSEYVAEAMLCWTMDGRAFEDIYELLPEKIK